MISNKIVGSFLVLLILFLSLVLLFVADTFGVVNMSKTFPFLRPEPEPVTAEHEPPDMLATEELKKEWQRLAEAQEKLEVEKLKIEEEKEALLELKDKLEEKQNGIEAEKNKLQADREMFAARKDKIEDMALKIGQMPPEAAVKILLTWSDYDIIAVFKRMDEIAIETNEESITAFLITRLDAAEPGRGGAIAKKMLQSPQLAATDSDGL